MRVKGSVFWSLSVASHRLLYGTSQSGPWLKFMMRVKGSVFYSLSMTLIRDSMELLKVDLDLELLKGICSFLFFFKTWELASPTIFSCGEMLEEAELVLEKTRPALQLWRIFVKTNLFYLTRKATWKYIYLKMGTYFPHELKEKLTENQTRVNTMFYILKYRTEYQNTYF